MLVSETGGAGSGPIGAGPRRGGVGPGRIRRTGAGAATGVFPLPRVRSIKAAETGDFGARLGASKFFEMRGEGTCSCAVERCLRGVGTARPKKSRAGTTRYSSWGTVGEMERTESEEAAYARDARDEVVDEGKMLMYASSHASIVIDGIVSSVEGSDRASSERRLGVSDRLVEACDSSESESSEK